MLRSILHCDMNNFYASVECMLDPALKKYPIAVCGSVEERHGIVLAKNYKAKAFDVKTGDAVWQAKQKCKDLVVVPPHYEEYIKYSKLARSVYERYTDQVEPYGMEVNEARIKQAKEAAGIEEETNTWAGWKQLGYEVVHGSKALFGCDLIWGSKGDGATYKARFFGASQVQEFA